MMRRTAPVPSTHCPPSYADAAEGVTDRQALCKLADSSECAVGFNSVAVPVPRRVRHEPYRADVGHVTTVGDRHWHLKAPQDLASFLGFLPFGGMAHAPERCAPVPQRARCSLFLGQVPYFLGGRELQSVLETLTGRPVLGLRSPKRKDNPRQTNGSWFVDVAAADVGAFLALHHTVLFHRDGVSVFAERSELADWMGHRDRFVAMLQQELPADAKRRRCLLALVVEHQH